MDEVGKINENEYQFLKEYEDLCKKYKTSFTSCGCCGGIHLTSNYDDVSIWMDDEEGCLNVNGLKLDEYKTINGNQEEYDKIMKEKHEEEMRRLYPFLYKK